MQVNEQRWLWRVSTFSQARMTLRCSECLLFYRNGGYNRFQLGLKHIYILGLLDCIFHIIFISIEHSVRQKMET